MVQERVHTASAEGLGRTHPACSVWAERRPVSALGGVDE